ncbi:hypothetical protein HUJ05_003087 [Dendroctonus ponderosae]|nr:hypothetical protein HUJ05_003087 [Dendroctonus ponderosae]
MLPGNYSEGSLEQMWVIMADRASAERACKEPNPIIDGRKANVNLAILGAKPRGNVPTEFLASYKHVGAEASELSSGDKDRETTKNARQLFISVKQ